MVTRVKQTPRTFWLAIGISFAGLAGCTSAPTSNTVTDAHDSSHASASTPLTRRTPVIAERPARMYIWAGFNPENCAPITPTLTVAEAPKKGQVTFRQNQMTRIMQSTSGKCVGQNLPGTGIYYTAHKGQRGPDHFSISAATKGEAPVTRAFSLTISE